MDHDVSHNLSDFENPNASLLNTIVEYKTAIENLKNEIDTNKNLLRFNDDELLAKTEKIEELNQQKLEIESNLKAVIDEKDRTSLLFDEQALRLTTIEAIINADLIKNEDFGLKFNELLIEKVETIIKSRLIPFIDQLDFFENKKRTFDSLDNSLKKWKNIKMKPWLERKAVVAFLGKFSSGKSSIINSLIQEDLLAVDVNETTAVPTYISFGDQLMVKFADVEDKLKYISTNLFKTFSKKTFDGLKIASLVKHFIVEYPVPKLTNLSILDTPGYDSLEKEDQEKAIEVLNESQHVFWIVDINDGDLKEDSLKFIQENLKEQSLYVVLSKADQLPLASQQASVAEQVEQTLRKREIQFEQVILFSKKREALKNEFNLAIEKIFPVFGKDFFVTIGSLIIEIRNEIGRQIVALKEENSDLEFIKEKLESEKGSHLQNYNSDKTKLGSKINSLGYVSNYTLKEYFKSLENSSAKIIDNFASTKKIGAIEQRIESLLEKQTTMEQKSAEIFSIEQEFRKLIN